MGVCVGCLCVGGIPVDHVDHLDAHGHRQLAEHGLQRRGYLRTRTGREGEEWEKGSEGTREAVRTGLPAHTNREGVGRMGEREPGNEKARMRRAHSPPHSR